MFDPHIVPFETVRCPPRIRICHPIVRQFLSRQRESLQISSGVLRDASNSCRFAKKNACACHSSSSWKDSVKELSSGNPW